MFSTRGNKLLLVISLKMLFKQYYLLSPVEAVHGTIWNKNQRDFVNIFSIESFEKINQQRLLISQEIENHDFNGVQLKFTSFPIQNLITFEKSNTVVTGVYGDMWQVLSKMLNFELHNIKLERSEYGIQRENGSWDGLLGYIYRNETDIIPRTVVVSSRLSALDFTSSAWITAYRFCMKNQLHYHQTWMTELFSRELWFSIIGLFLVVTLCTRFSEHLMNFNEEKSRKSVSNLRDHFFYIFSIFCNQGWTPKQLENCSRILLISTRLFAWLLIIAFSSKLMSHIAQRQFYSPFQDLESLYKETNYKLIVKGNSLIYSVFKTSKEPIYKTIINSGRLIQASGLEAYEKICTGEYVYLESQDVIQAENPTLCEVNFVGDPYLTTWIAGGVVRGFKYKRTIDLGILKLNEFGIMNRLKLKWLKKSMAIKISHAQISIELEHLLVVFAMLICALLLSLVILLFENIIYFESIKDRRKKLILY